MLLESVFVFNIQENIANAKSYVKATQSLKNIIANFIEEKLHAVINGDKSEKKLASEQHNLNVPRLYLGKERCRAEAFKTLGWHQGVYDN